MRSSRAVVSASSTRCCLLAVLGTADKASELVRDLPFAARTSALVFDMKLLLLLAIFVYAFFRFTWSMRQYTFGALLVAAAPEAKRFLEEGLSREEFADKAGRVVGMAAETFNDGLRGYYFAFAAIGWQWGGRWTATPDYQHFSADGG